MQIAEEVAEKTGTGYAAVRPDGTAEASVFPGAAKGQGEVTENLLDLVI